MNYRLSIDGDSREIKYAGIFLDKDFPAYEEFWKKYIVRLTNRPDDLHFKCSGELAKIGCGDQELQIAQLHYTILVRLAATSELMKSPNIVYEQLSWAIFSLVAAQDVALELLSRTLLVRNNSSKCFNSRESEKVRNAWIAEENKVNDQYWSGVKKVRKYRNSLTHGHVFPSEIKEDVTFPLIGHQDKYSKWSIITENKHDPKEFGLGKDIVQSAWNYTLEYLQERWENQLLKSPTVIKLLIPSKTKGMASCYQAIASVAPQTSGTSAPYVVPFGFQQSDSKDSRKL